MYGILPIDVTKEIFCSNLIKIKNAGSIGGLKPKTDKDYVLKELQNPYNPVFAPEKCTLRLKNDHFGRASS